MEKPPKVDKSKLTRIPECDSITTEAYCDETHLYLFGKFDGHLALKYNRKTRKVEYVCEHFRFAGKKLIEYLISKVEHAGKP